MKRYFPLSLLCIIFILIPIQGSPADQDIKDIKVYFSPNGGCEEAIVNEINNAKKEILIAMFSFTKKGIIRALKEASTRGVNIMVIVDEGKPEEKNLKKIMEEDLKIQELKSELETGTKNIKVSVYKGGVRGIMHNKFAVIDDAIIITGSYNWTENAERFNYENLLIISSPEIAKKYREEFKKIYEEILSERENLRKFYKTCL